LSAALTTITLSAALKKNLIRFNSNPFFSQLNPFRPHGVILGETSKKKKIRAIEWS